MTSRDTTRLLALPEDATDESATPLSDLAMRILFGTIGWPWLLYSLWGGTKASKRRLLKRVGLADDALPNLGSWKADTGFLHRIVDAVEELRPQVVVELGAGASTLVCAKALAMNGGGKLISFDQHRDFVTATARWVAEEGAEVDLRWAPLMRQETDWPGRWYALHGVPDKIDLIIIDGPPWAVHPFVRGGAEVLFDRLAPGGMVLLDDAARPGERIVARRWRRNWPQMRFERLGGSSKGTLVGRKAQAAGTAQHQATANDNTAGFAWHKIAAMLALFGAGWLAHDLTGNIAPAAQAATIVDEAHASYTASRARADITALAPTANSANHADIAARAGVDLPALPGNWQVRDVQLYPSDLGNSLSLSVTTDEGERLGLFAARAETPAEDEPLLEHRDTAAIAYWEEGPFAYALIGEVPDNVLLKQAESLADAPQG